MAEPEGSNGNTLSAPVVGVLNDVWDEASHTLRVGAGSGALRVSKTVTYDGTSGNGTTLTKATDTVTINSVQDSDTITIDGHTYTFQTILVDSPDNVLIGVSDATALDNLKSAINATAGAGTTYGTGTTAHATVSATTNTNTTQVVEALIGGEAGNSIAVSSSGATLTWDTPTLTGGAEGTTALFTVSGTVLVALIAVCSDDLVGATATLEVGNATSTDRYINQVTATDIDAGDTVDLGGEVTVGTPPEMTPNQVAFDAESIIDTVGTADITAGTLTYYAFYQPLSAGATVTAA